MIVFTGSFYGLVLNDQILNDPPRVLSMIASL